jgi:hypothetical protein
MHIGDGISCRNLPSTQKKKKTFFNQDFADPSTITSLQMLGLSLGRAFGRTSA